MPEGLIDRVVRVARLDASPFDEVPRDEAATSQAVLVVVASLANDVETGLA